MWSTMSRNKGGCITTVAFNTSQKRYNVNLGVLGDRCSVVGEERTDHGPKGTLILNLNTAALVSLQ